MLEMSLVSALSIVNMLLVSRLGDGAVAVVGLTESVLILISSLSVGLNVGSSATVSRRVGEKAPERAAVAAVQAVFLCVLLSAPLVLIGLFFPRGVLSLLGGSPAVAALGEGYMRVLLGGSTALLLVGLLGSLLRSAGAAVSSLRALLITNLASLALAPLLIWGLGPLPGLGLAGAALAAVLARCAGIGYQLRRLTGGAERLTLRREHLRVEPAVLGAIARLTSGALIQSLLASGSWIALIAIVSRAEPGALPAYAIAFRLSFLVLSLSFGMSAAVAALVGQSLGAKKPERAERIVGIAGRYNLVLFGALAATFIAAAGPLAGLFTDDPAVAGAAAACLRLSLPGFFCYAYGIVFTSALNGAGTPKTAAAGFLVCFWLLELPLAYALIAPLGLGARGAFLASSISFLFLTIYAALAFRRGRWKLAAV